MSSRTFARRFRQETGATPHAWITAQRVRRAEQLLEATDHPVERVAAEVGFGNAAALATTSPAPRCEPAGLPAHLRRARLLRRPRMVVPTGDPGSCSPGSPSRLDLPRGPAGGRRPGGGIGEDHQEPGRLLATPRLPTPGALGSTSPATCRWCCPSRCRTRLGPRASSPWSTRRPTCGCTTLSSTTPQRSTTRSSAGWPKPTPTPADPRDEGSVIASPPSVARGRLASACGRPEPRRAVAVGLPLAASFQKTYNCSRGTRDQVLYGALGWGDRGVALA